jgi:hypothetical protein
MTQSSKPSETQLIHLVFGGELNDIKSLTFKDLSQLDVVGFFPNHAAAHQAWLSKARETIDNAQMRYFIVHLHRLLDPTTDTQKKKPARKKA